MTWNKFYILVVLFLFATKCTMAQDTLPRFTVKDLGEGRVVVSWTNPYNSNLVQLTVQRSYDSIKRFSSIYSAPSPELPQNGISDKVTPGVRIFYRIFYVMKGGAYFFTRSLKPGTALSSTDKYYDSRRDLLNENLMSDSLPETQPITVKIRDTTVTMFGKEFKNFRDSILIKTNDTLLQQSTYTVLLAVYSPVFIQHTSQYVFTDRDGFIVVKLPGAAKRNYEVNFMEEDDTPVLQLKALKEDYITLDKINFYHGGWYKFEIKENASVLERNKIYLATDF